MSYVLVWSKKENALRIESMEQMLSRNREAYRDDSGNDFLPIATGDMPTLLMAAESVRRTLAERETERTDS